MLVLGFVLLSALFGPVLVPRPINPETHRPAVSWWRHLVEFEAAHTTSREQYQPPSKEHLFGTDNNGRDAFARVIEGARISLLVGLSGALLNLFVGTAYGLISGYVGGIPGVHAMWAGADWTWHKPVLRNQEIRTEAWLKDLIEHETRFAGRAVQQVYHVRFFNQSGDLVAEADSWCFRTDRDTARESGTKYTEVKARPPQTYTEDELARIYRLYHDETVRGAQVRYWDDVTAGEALPPMVKGPMTVTGFIAYAQGWGGLYIRANKLAWKQIHAHPGLGIANRFGIPDCPERVHWEPEFALMVGAPGAYDYGPERCSWLTHHLTNWMGDDGFLRQASCKIRRHNPEGDTLFFNGTVVRKYIADGRHLVEISQEARNQTDEVSVLGTGVVELPVRRAA